MYTLPYFCFTHEELEALSGVNDRDLLNTLRDFFEADTDGDLPYVAAEKPVEYVRREAREQGMCSLLTSTPLRRDRT